jgi:hypothetical protein
VNRTLLGGLGLRDKSESVCVRVGDRQGQWWSVLERDEKGACDGQSRDALGRKGGRRISSEAIQQLMLSMGRRKNTEINIELLTDGRVSAEGL